MQNRKNTLKAMFLVFMLLMTSIAVTACGSDETLESGNTTKSSETSESDSSMYESGGTAGTGNTAESSTDYSGGAGGTMEESSTGAP